MNTERKNAKGGKTGSAYRGKGKGSLDQEAEVVCKEENVCIAEEEVCVKMKRE